MRFAMSSLLVAALAALAGCPPPTQGGGGTTGPQPIESEVGCPTGSDVYIASYLAAEPGKGHTGWVLPVRDDKVTTVDGVPDFEELAAQPSPPLDAPRTQLWILQPGIAPCRAQLGKPYRAGIPSPAPPNIAYGYELDGCPAPMDQEADEAVVVGSPSAPGQCQIVTPHPVAARMGEVDQQKMWTPPKKQTAIPAPIAPLVPQHACAAPGCEALWTFVQVDVGTAAVAWAGAINWMQTGQTPAPVDQVCKWPVETYSGFFVPGPGGQAVKVDAGQDHPLGLTAVLADHGGARVLLADTAGEYSTYDLAPDGARLARHLTWLVAAPAAYADDDRVGPVCDPGQAAGGVGQTPAPQTPSPPLQPLSQPAHP